MKILYWKKNILHTLLIDVSPDILMLLMFANEMNRYAFLPKKMQYDFYLNSLRKKKRFSPWLRKDKVDDLEIVKRYYGYSNEKALQALKILNKEQLNFIRSKFETGGKK